MEVNAFVVDDCSVLLRAVLVSVILVIALHALVAVQGSLSGDVGCVDGGCPDNVYYARMVHGVSVPAPFAYRLLTPWLARVTPGGFGAITFVALTTFLVLLCFVQTELGVREVYAYVGVLLAAADFWIVEFFVIDKGLVDPLALALLAGGTLAVLRDKWWIAVAALGLAVLNKEVGILLLAPLAWRSVQMRRFDVLAASLCVVVTTLALPRLLIEPSGTSYGVGASWPVSLAEALRNARDLTWSVWGLLIPLALLAHPRTLLRNASLLALIAGAYLQLPFATDSARLLAPASVAIVPFAMLGAQRVPVPRPSIAVVLTAALVAGQVLVFQGQRRDLHRLIDALEVSRTSDNR